ncbi:MAG: radical SAM protein [Infirmifilum sp.]
MSYIKPFDPWRKGSLCTCPFKYTVNPYTGCSHGCLYCYASSYIKDFFTPRPKRDFLERARRDLEKIPRNSIINVSSSSDPYQPLEAELGYTRGLLRLIGDKHYVEIVTKSDLVVRDVDLLSRLRALVSVTITTLDESLARRLEPNAPSPARRILAMGKLAEHGIPLVVRLDPLIPALNDTPDSIREVLEAASSAGARHVVSSTYKVKPDNLRRLAEAFPDLTPRIRQLYEEGGDRIHGYIYADKKYRLEVLSLVKREAEKLGLSFATCREGFQFLHTPGVHCDGTHLLLKGGRRKSGSSTS